MKKWIFAIANLMEGENKLYTIDAEGKTDVEAVGDALIEMCKSQETKDSQLQWFAEDAAEDIDELIDQLVDMDLLVTKPIMGVL